MVKVMFSEQLGRLKFNFNKPSVKSLWADYPNKVLHSTLRDREIEKRKEREREKGGGMRG